MKNRYFVFNVSDFTLLLTSLAFFVGTFTFCKACGQTDSGAYMSCHWAENALKGVTGVMLLLSVAHLIIRDYGVKPGLDIAVCALAILAMLIPGTLINTCSMPNMRCNAVMRPCAIIFSAFATAFSVIDLVFYLNKKRKSK